MIKSDAHLEIRRLEDTEILAAQLTAQRAATAACEAMIRRMIKTAPYPELIADAKQALETTPKQHLAAVRQTQKALADAQASLEASFGDFRLD